MRRFAELEQSLQPGEDRGAARRRMVADFIRERMFAQSAPPAIVDAIAGAFLDGNIAPVLGLAGMVRGG
jgi:hypothetical protein